MWDDSPILNFMKSLGKGIPVHAYRLGNKTHINLYVPLDGLNAHASKFLEEEGAKASGENYVVSMQLDESRELGLIGDLLEQSLVVVNSIYLKEGWLMFDFRFHSSRYREISGLISRYISNGSGVKLVYLGPSPGLISLLGKLNDEIPLSVVMFEAHITPGVEIPLSPTVGETLLLESTNHVGEDDSQRFIAYRSSDDAITEVSEVQVNTPILRRMREESNRSRTVRYNVFVKVEEVRAVIMIFLPSSLLHTYLSILASVSSELAEGSINLIASSPFSLDVIDEFE